MPDSRPTVFELHHVSYSYLQGEPALREVNLRVFQGEKLVILGANGCGKSTLQKILDGLVFPEEGTVRVFEQELSEKALEEETFSHNFRRRVGFVMQNSDAQLFNSSVWDEIAFGPLQMGLSSAEVSARVQSVMEMLALTHLRDRPPYRLSGGEKKKVAIASVLSVNPEVLILDEPTSGLDPRTRRWLVDLLVELNRAGKTVITATHDLDIVGEIGERVLVFGEDHRIMAEGSPNEILKNRQLLISVNLVDEYYHEHRHEQHSHFHLHTH